MPVQVPEVPKVHWLPEARAHAVAGQEVACKIAVVGELLRSPQDELTLQWHDRYHNGERDHRYYLRGQAPRRRLSRPRSFPGLDVLHHSRPWAATAPPNPIPAPEPETPIRTRRQDANFTGSRF